MPPGFVLRAALGFLPESETGRKSWQGKEVLTYPCGLYSIHPLYLAERLLAGWLALSL